MNRFNTTIQIKQSVDVESNDIGSTFQGWADRGEPMRAERMIIRGKVEDIANREQATMYCRFKIRASNIARTIVTSDRLYDLTSARVHDILNWFEDDDRRFITIETRSFESQSIYS